VVFNRQPRPTQGQLRSILDAKLENFATAGPESLRYVDEGILPFDLPDAAIRFPA